MYDWPQMKPETEDMFTNCLRLCSDKHMKGPDSDKVPTCRCMVCCASTFDGAMLECVQAQSDTTKLTYEHRGALRGTPGSAYPHSPSQMPLSCPVAPQAARSR